MAIRRLHVDRRVSAGERCRDRRGGRPWRGTGPARVKGPRHSRRLDRSTNSSGGCTRARALCFPGDERHSDPGPKSSVILEVEVPAERLDRAVGEAVRALRSGLASPVSDPASAPTRARRVLGEGAVLDEAVDRPRQASYRDALIDQAILPSTNADVEIVQAEEGKLLIFKATVQIRRKSPSATTGTSTSSPRSRPSTTPRSRRSSRSSATRTRRCRRSRTAAPEGRLRGHQVRGLRRDALRRRHGRAECR